VGVFLAMFAVQKTTVLRPLYNMKFEGATKPGEKMTKFTQFFAEVGGPSAAWFVNTVTSSIVAGGARPIVDGKPKP